MREVVVLERGTKGADSGAHVMAFGLTTLGKFGRAERCPMRPLPIVGLSGNSDDEIFGRREEEEAAVIDANRDRVNLEESELGLRSDEGHLDKHLESLVVWVAVAAKEGKRSLEGYEVGGRFNDGQETV